MKPIKVAVIGVGNCASSLVQGVAYYRSNNSSQGLIHDRIGGYGAGDVDFVLGIDVDARKVGKDIAEAIFSAPNNTTVFHQNVPATGAKVIMGKALDGVAEHMTTAGDKGFIVADAPEATLEGIVEAIKASGAEVLINFLPVGSQEATEFYMEAALEAGVAVVNCMPVFIASRPEWERRFAE
jgi:myo-inositol-1-phosphate synthase